MSRHQGISKAGNPKARSTMIEPAWMWLRHQPGSSLSAWLREHVGSLKGPHSTHHHRGSGKLLVCLWRYLEAGVLPTDIALKKG